MGVTVLTLRPIDAPESFPARESEEAKHARTQFAMLHADGVRIDFDKRLWAMGEVDGRRVAMVSGFYRVEVYAPKEVGGDLLGVVLGTASALAVQDGEARVAITPYGPAELQFEHDPATARWFAVDLPASAPPAVEAKKKAKAPPLAVSLVEHPAVPVGKTVFLGRMPALHATPPAVTTRSDSSAVLGERVIAPPCDYPRYATRGRWLWATSPGAGCAWEMDLDAPEPRWTRAFDQAGAARAVMPLGDDRAVVWQGSIVGEPKAGVTLFRRDAQGWQALERLDVSKTAQVVAHPTLPRVLVLGAKDLAVYSTEGDVFAKRAVVPTLDGGEARLTALRVDGARVWLARAAKTVRRVNDPDELPVEWVREVVVG